MSLAQIKDILKKFHPSTDTKGECTYEQCVQRLVLSPWAPSQEDIERDEVLRAKPVRTLKQKEEDRVRLCKLQDVSKLSSAEMKLWLQRNGGRAPPGSGNRRSMSRAIRNHMRVITPCFVKKVAHQRPKKRGVKRSGLAGRDAVRTPPRKRRKLDESSDSIASRATEERKEPEETAVTAVRDIECHIGDTASMPSPMPMAKLFATPIAKQGNQRQSLNQMMQTPLMMPMMPLMPMQTPLQTPLKSTRKQSETPVLSALKELPETPMMLRLPTTPTQPQRPSPALTPMQAPKRLFTMPDTPLPFRPPSSTSDKRSAKKGGFLSAMTWG